ncbi:mitochondrial 54S ribosomal protein YmL20 [Arthroderma uncinatum]|uniref:mitochondrial 54S ribosomal protein YmL20 n=1 Tax=Arthroderma uncinatum TaxID=74035 RepID=UPI00144ACE3C|nr:mitochondrial 54S ribosomal protein YmL20 [Arthroderma uncinatum]KAF3479984.1 mitochondrial 54S ribosomal protein YmL20 [Arthroderma uncinatum]
MASTAALTRRPVLNLLFCPEFQPQLSRRWQSSYRRTKKRLRVKPDASFSPSSSTECHIIHNPPSSAPSVYLTPTKFLPANDVRRTLRRESETAADASPAQSLSNGYRDRGEKKYLSKEEIEAMRELRKSDPMVWSRAKLAERFGCSNLFVGMVCEAAVEKKAIQRQILTAVQSRWGVKRTMAREDRQLRKELWGRDK